MPRAPRCPDCSGTKSRPIIYGEPDSELALKAERREVVLGGCIITDDKPVWDCPDCGLRFGKWKMDGKPEARSPDEWRELIKTMLPKPVRVDKTGELRGGNPVLVRVRVESSIVIMTAKVEWVDSHRFSMTGHPFADMALTSSASQVADRINLAWSKRLSTYRWCPRCRSRFEPEHMLEALCHGCATRVLGVVY